jgi:hypothetical protein
MGAFGQRGIDTNQRECSVHILALSINHNHLTL